jgi:hypothetical protein
VTPTSEPLTFTSNNDTYLAKFHSSLGTTDEHERDKDFLTEQEGDDRRQAARARRYGAHRPENDGFQ